MIQEQAEVWGAGEGQEDHAFFGLSPEQIDVLSCAAALVPAMLGLGSGAEILSGRRVSSAVSSRTVLVRMENSG